MMELFSEIYGQYYHIMTRLLKNGEQTPEAMRKTIYELGYEETALYFQPNIADGTWPLFNKISNGNYKPIVHNVPDLPLTNLEKAWLKAVLEDDRARLFLTDEEIAFAKEKLADVEPLYLGKNILNFDQFNVGDDYKDNSVQNYFSLLLEAMNSSQMVKINYLSAKGKDLEGLYIPCKFEYSPKNDKIRCLAIQVKDNKCCDYTVFNLGRITNVELVKEVFPQNYQEYFENKRCQSENTIEVELTDERNAMERFMVEFSNYRKEAIYDKERDILNVTMWYDGLDETEILVKLLGFGPVLKVAGPDSFIDKIKERLRKQKELDK